MLARSLRLAALMLFVAVPSAVAAPQDKKDAKPAPAVVVRVAAVNDLLKTVDYLAGLAPEQFGEQIKQGIAAAKDFIDPKTGFEGIAVDKPIGMYVNFTADGGATPPLVVLVPIADEATVLKALEDRLQLKVEKLKDGLFKTDVEQFGMPVFFRFANGYAYLTIMDEANIEAKSLLKPEDVLAGKSEHMISATLRIDRLPEDMRTTALAFIEQNIAAAKDQPLPNETKAIKDFRDKAVDELVANIKSVLEGGEEAALRLNVDPKAEEVALEIELKGKAGSKLAKDIASIKDNKSVVGGALAYPDAALNVNLSVSFPKALKSLLPTVVDDAVAAMKKEANVPGEFEQKAEPLIKALLPTVKGGDLDLGAALVGPDKDDKYTAVVALRVVDGKKIESAIKDLVKKELPPEYSAFLQLDSGKLSNGSMVHTLKVSEMKDGDKPALDENAVKLFGKSDLHLTFRDDLVVAAFGPGAKDSLEKAVTSKPADVGVLQVTASLSRIAPIMGDNAAQLAEVKKVAEKVFGKGGSKADTIKFAIEGGESFKIKLSAKGKALAFLMEVGGAAASKEN